MKVNELKSIIDGLDLFPEYYEQINNILNTSAEEISQEEISKVVELIQNNITATELSAKLLNSAADKIKSDISKINNLNQDN